jgi:hypothetical protein
MSIFKRIGSIIKSSKQAPAVPVRNAFEDSSVGDIVNVDLQQYVITGKVVYFDRGFAPHRYAYYLQNGRNISCLLVEKGRTYECFLCDFLEGSLDSPHDVPTKLELDGQSSFQLDHHRTDVTRAEGNTDFRSGDDVLFWRYFGQDEEYFFLQWQDGKFVAMRGERTPSSQVKFMNTAP